MEEECCLAAHLSGEIWWLSCFVWILLWLLVFLCFSVFSNSMIVVNGGGKITFPCLRWRVVPLSFRLSITWRLVITRFVLNPSALWFLPASLFLQFSTQKYFKSFIIIGSKKFWCVRNIIDLVQVYFGAVNQNNYYAFNYPAILILVVVQASGYRVWMRIWSEIALNYYLGCL